MKALFRVIQTIPQPEYDAKLLRPSSGLPVALLCGFSQCDQCKQWKSSNRRIAYEKQQFSHVLKWDCSNRKKKEFAQKHGVTDLPAYIVFPVSPSEINVVLCRDL